MLRLLEALGPEVAKNLGIAPSADLGGDGQTLAFALEVAPLKKSAIGPDGTIQDVALSVATVMNETTAKGSPDFLVRLTHPIRGDRPNQYASAGVEAERTAGFECGSDRQLQVQLGKCAEATTVAGSEGGVTDECLIGGNRETREGDLRPAAESDAAALELDAIVGTERQEVRTQRRSPRSGLAESGDCLIDNDLFRGPVDSRAGEVDRVGAEAQLRYLERLVGATIDELVSEEPSALALEDHIPTCASDLGAVVVPDFVGGEAGGAVNQSGVPAADVFARREVGLRDVSGQVEARVRRRSGGQE